MSYCRVIPRDLFNDANLLKCYGQVYLNLEKMGLQDWLVEGHSFYEYGPMIHQHEADGSTTIANIMLVKDSQSYPFSRPLNSRDPFPLYMVMPDDEEMAVLEDDGRFTDEMKAFLRGD